MPRPDIVVVGKAIAADYRYPSLSTQKHLWRQTRRNPSSGMALGTFPGYAAGISSAIMVLDIIKEEHLVENAQNMGGVLSGILSDFCATYRNKYRYNKSCFTQGIGLMQGILFHDYNIIGGGTTEGIGPSKP